MILAFNIKPQQKLATDTFLIFYPWFNKKGNQSFPYNDKVYIITCIIGENNAIPKQDSRDYLKK